MVLEGGASVLQEGARDDIGDPWMGEGGNDEDDRFDLNPARRCPREEVPEVSWKAQRRCPEEVPEVSWKAHATLPFPSR